MKNIINKIKNHKLCSYLIFNILFLLVTGFLFTFRLSTYKLNATLYIPLLIINIIIIILYLLFKKKNKEKIRFKSFDFFLIIFIIFTLISSILSINTSDAFFGRVGRYEGFFQIMYYISLFFISSFLDKEEKKVVSYAIITLGLCEVIQAHIQKFDLFGVPVIHNDGKPWATGYTCNPNFFGSLSVLVLSIVIGLLFDSKTKKVKIIYFILISIFTSGLLISDTLSALVGLIVLLIYVFTYALNKKKKLLFLILMLIISLLTLIESLTKKTDLINDLIKTKDQSIEIAKGNVQDNFGTNRMFIWKETIKVVPDNLTYGVGVDNFYYAFGDRPLSRKHRYFDKAHNEYLQILVCEGIYALVSYLIFIFIILIKGIKYSFKKETLFFVAPVIAYLVQAFFNISVIEVAPIFYICLGLLSNRDKTNN